jgi:hypothetical protein
MPAPGCELFPFGNGVPAIDLEPPGRYTGIVR